MAGGAVSAADGGQWGALLGGETVISEAAMLSAGMAQPPQGLGLALGWLDKWLVVDPRSNTTVVAFGQTLGASRMCGEEYSCPVEGVYCPGWGLAIDGAYSASLMWRSLARLFPPATAATVDNRTEER